MIKRIGKKIYAMLFRSSQESKQNHPQQEGDAERKQSKHSHRKHKKRETVERKGKIHHQDLNRSHRKKGRHDENEKRQPIKLPELEEVPVIEGKYRFLDLDIDKSILCGLQEMGITHCTPIQEKSLPHALKGVDLTGKAQTGTGKTAAFLTAAFNNLLKNRQQRKKGSCRVLVLAPTRELAVQIHKDAEEIGKYCGFMNAKQAKAQCGILMKNVFTG